MVWDCKNCRCQRLHVETRHWARMSSGHWLPNAPWCGIRQGRVRTVQNVLSWTCLSRKEKDGGRRSDTSQSQESQSSYCNKTDLLPSSFHWRSWRSTQPCPSDSNARAVCRATPSCPCRPSWLTSPTSRRHRLASSRSTDIQSYLRRGRYAHGTTRSSAAAGSWVTLAGGDLIRTLEPRGCNMSYPCIAGSQSPVHRKTQTQAHPTCQSGGGIQEAELESKGRNSVEATVLSGWASRNDSGWRNLQHWCGRTVDRAGNTCTAWNNLMKDCVLNHAGTHHLI